MNRRRRRRALLLAASVLVAVAVFCASLVWRLGPGSERAERMARAEHALAAGELAGESGAVALFLEVLADEPDHELARRGLIRAGEEALRSAEGALHRGERAKAIGLLAAARAAGVAESRLEAVEARIRSLDPDRSRLLEEAARAEAAGDVEVGLLARLAANLAEDPGDVELARRFERLVGQRASLATAWLAAGDLARARAELETLMRIAPGRPAVVALEAAVLDAERTATEWGGQE